MDLENQTDEQLAARDMELQALLEKRLSHSDRAALREEREAVWGEMRYRQARSESASRIASVAAATMNIWKEDCARMQSITEATPDEIDPGMAEDTAYMAQRALGWGPQGSG